MDIETILSLLKKCPSLELFWSAFSCIRTGYRLSLRIQSECRKMRTRITPKTNTSHVVYLMLFWFPIEVFIQYLVLWSFQSISFSLTISFQILCAIFPTRMTILLPLLKILLLKNLLPGQRKYSELVRSSISGLQAVISRNWAIAAKIMTPIKSMTLMFKLLLINTQIISVRISFSQLIMR